MRFDDILVNHLGQFGRYQAVQYFLVGLPTIFTALHSLSWTFTGAKVKHRCLYPGENSTAAYAPGDQWSLKPKNITDKKVTKSQKYRASSREGQSSAPSRAGRRDVPVLAAVVLYLYSTFQPFGLHEMTNCPDNMHKDIALLSGNETGCSRVANVSLGQYPPPRVRLSMEACLDGYAWDHTDMILSAVGRWALVCGSDVIRAVVQCMYFIGQFFGSLIFGVLSDKLGRKPIFVMAIILQIACGAGMAVVPWWPLFAILRIGVGFAHPGIFVMAVVIGAELVGPKYRVLSSVGVGFFFAFGEIILGALAYPLRDFRYLQLSISLPALVFLGYWWLVPESARWLISRGRFQDADRVLQQVAKCNGRDPLPSDWYAHIEKEKVKPHLTSREAITALFRTPNLRKRTLITFVIWPVVSMCFYGLAINPAFMGGDNRLGFILGGALEIPGLLVVLFALNIFGRKLLISGGFLLAALCLLLTLAVPESLGIANMILVVVGKSALTAVYATVYIMTPEHYPTIIRNTATGACSMIARAGGVTASFMSQYLADTYPLIVLLIFAGSSLVAGILALILPETTGEPLLETIEEAEAFGVGQPIFLSGLKNQRLVAERMHQSETTQDSS